jgi:basic membrane protein A
MDGTWKSESYWGPMSDGIVDLAPLTQYAPDGAQAKVDEVKQQMMKGSFKIFNGELKDQDGNVKVKAGEEMSDSDIWNMSWFVEGVVGKIQ